MAVSVSRSFENCPGSPAVFSATVADSPRRSEGCISGLDTSF